MKDISTIWLEMSGNVVHDESSLLRENGDSDDFELYIIKVLFVPVMLNWI